MRKYSLFERIYSLFERIHSFYNQMYSLCSVTARQSMFIAALLRLCWIFNPVYVKDHLFVILFRMRNEHSFGIRRQSEFEPEQVLESPKSAQCGSQLLIRLSYIRDIFRVVHQGHCESFYIKSLLIWLSSAPGEINMCGSSGPRLGKI